MGSGCPGGNISKPIQNATFSLLTKNILLSLTFCGFERRIPDDAMVAICEVVLLGMSVTSIPNGYKSSV